MKSMNSRGNSVWNSLLPYLNACKNVVTQVELCCLSSELQHLYYVWFSRIECFYKFNSFFSLVCVFLYKLKALSLYQGMSVATKHVSFVVVIFVVYVLNPVYSGSNRLVT